MSISRTVCFVSFTILASTVSLTATADLDTSLANLKACVSENLPEERAKDIPSAEAILLACDDAYRAVGAEIPYQELRQITHMIKDQIRERLQK